MHSINTCSRARTNKRTERGIVLIAALVLAVLYFALMELMMVDASRALSEAQRFRARVVASTLAENGIELAAAQMVTAPDPQKKTYSDELGTSTGKLQATSNAYIVTGTGATAGVVQQTMTATLQGRIETNTTTNSPYVTIDYAEHSQ